MFDFDDDVYECDFDDQICELDTPWSWADDECFTCPHYAHVYHECTVGGCEYAVNPWVDDDTLPNEDIRPANEVI